MTINAKVKLPWTLAALILRKKHFKVLRNSELAITALNNNIQPFINSSFHSKC